MDTDSQLLRSLADREAIRDCLFRYSRGIDRCDAELLRGACWPDVRARRLDFEGNAEEFIAWAMPKIKTLDIAMHNIGNILIQLQGDEAVVESTFMNYRRMDVEGEKRDQISGGRYLDRFQRRGDEWRIAKRLVVMDWSRAFANPADIAGLTMALDKRFPDDVSYQWLKSR